MCCGNHKVRTDKVHKVHNSGGEVNKINQNDTYLNIHEHVDDPLLNRNLRTGILGFRYEMKKSTIIIYLSIEAKTFCMLMRIEPLRLLH